MAGALEGIRVIDLTVWFQGPVAAQHLADFGAEVIHVERPKGGDQGRGVRSIKALPVGDWNQYFGVINRNKKSMAIDLKKPGGHEIMKRLVEESDVFLSNLTPDSLERSDLGYETLRDINPRLVYATTTGYGHYGQIRKPSFDMTVQALTGLMTRLGEPGEPPIYLGMGSGDAIGGLMAALGILLALHQRETTGKGQLLDASLYGAQLFLAAPSLQAYLATGSDRYSQQQSRTSPMNPLKNTYPTEDAWLFLCEENTDASFSKVCRALESPGLSRDPRFQDADKREAHATGLVEAFETALKTRTADAWMERFEPLGITASRICTFEDLARDPQAWENDYLLETHCDEVDRKVHIRGLPIGLSRTPGTVRTLGPELGQDTEMILADTLGFDWDRIGEFKSEGAIP